jgi:hypothetical protein
LCVGDLIGLGRAGPDRNVVFDDRRHRGSRPLFLTA